MMSTLGSELGSDLGSDLRLKIKRDQFYKPNLPAASIAFSRSLIVGSLTYNSIDDAETMICLPLLTLAKQNKRINELLSTI
jgi:hypothetical protein